MNIRQTLTEHYDKLSPQLQIAALYISSHPESVVNHSLRKVAEESGVSPPTYSRLAKAVGLEGGYEELKSLCRQTLSERQSTFGEKAKALQQYKEGSSSKLKGTFVVEQAAAAIDNIQNMVERLAPEKLSEAADLLVAAPTVYIAGGLSSRSFADYLGYMSSMAFSHWQVLEVGKAPMGIITERLDPNGVMIVISMRPFYGKVAQLTELASQAGLKIIALTDCELGPISKHCDYIFNSPSQSPQFFSSYTATLVLLESIMAMVVQRGGEETQKRIESVENLNHQTGEYSDDSLY